MYFLTVKKKIMKEELRKFGLLHAAIKAAFPDADKDSVLIVSASLYASCAARGIEFIADAEEKKEEAEG